MEMFFGGIFVGAGAVAVIAGPFIRHYQTKAKNESEALSRACEFIAKMRRERDDAVAAAERNQWVLDGLRAGARSK